MLYLYKTLALLSMSKVFKQQTKSQLEQTTD